MRISSPPGGFLHAVAAVAVAAGSVAGLSAAPSAAVPPGPARAASTVEAQRGWTAHRALADDGSPATPVQVITARDKWELVASVVDDSCAGCPTSYRLREHVPGRGWAKPVSVPAKVQSLGWTNTPSGAVYVSYVHDGRIWVAFKSPHGPTLYRPWNLGAAVDGAVPDVTAASAGVAIIDYGDTWYRQDGNEPWYGHPQPPDAPADAHVFTTPYGGSLWFYNRAGQLVADGNLIAPQTLGPAADAEYMELANDRGDIRARIVTRDLDGDRTVRVYDANDSRTGMLIIDNPRALGPSGGPVQVAADNTQTLTVAWPEPQSAGAATAKPGTRVWQEDRWGGGLSTPTRIPGTRGRGTVDVEVSPNGTISAAYLADPTTAGAILVRHLPAGQDTWTKATRLQTPKPARRAPAFDLGKARSSNDMTLVVNDRAGVIAYTYDAPASLTRITRPKTPTVHKARYRVGWTTPWVFWHRYIVEKRVEKGHGFGPWKPFANIGKESDVLRHPAPAGQVRCYRAKALLARGQGETAWSKPRCFTYRP